MATKSKQGSDPSFD